MNVLYLSQCPVLQIFIGNSPLVCINVLNYIAVCYRFFRCCVSFVYVLGFVYVVLRFVYVIYVLCTLVYVPFVLFTCCVIYLVACGAWFDDFAVPRLITINFETSYVVNLFKQEVVSQKIDLFTTVTLHNNLFCDRLSDHLHCANRLFTYALRKDMSTFFRSWTFSWKQKCRSSGPNSNLMNWHYIDKTRLTYSSACLYFCCFYCCHTLEVITLAPTQP